MPNLDVNEDPRYLARRITSLEAATGQSAPAFGGAAPTPSALLVTLASGAVGSSQATVAHGLSYTPKIYGVVMTTAGAIYQSQSPDGTNIYLTADASARQANIILGR